MGAPLHVSESASDLRDQAARAVADGVDRLVVAGGDGTFHWTVQELAGSECALVPIPAGRGNDLASVLDVDGSTRNLVQRVTEGRQRSVDVGRAGQVYFVVHCGVGFDSEAARWANEQRILSGILAYPASVLRTLLRFQPPGYRIEYEGGSIDEEGMFVVCANCWRFGGGMKIAPDASIDDGLLDLVFSRRVGKLTALRLFGLVYSGRHIEHPALTVVQTPWIRLRLDRRMEMYGDGEAMETVDEEGLEVRVLPGALKVVS